MVTINQDILDWWCDLEEKYRFRIIVKAFCDAKRIADFIKKQEDKEDKEKIKLCEICNMPPGYCECGRRKFK